uniref:DNA-directed RNA polymerase n=1 Tax=Zygnema circumcarinatum TaxID=35869 RepID=A0A6N0GXJ7_ZYGCR|nr:DNA-dependent RNA polymerase [Zygnema circumcarinatum]
MEGIQRELEKLTIDFEGASSMFTRIPELDQRLKSESFGELARARVITLRTADREILERVVAKLGSHDWEVCAVLIYTISAYSNQYKEVGLVRVSTLVEAISRNLMFFYFEKLEDAGGGGVPLAEDKALRSTSKKRRVGRPRHLFAITRDASNPRYYPLGVMGLELLLKSDILRCTTKFGEVAEYDKSKLSFKDLKEYYCICTVEPASIPLKCNLPMICEPRNWVRVTSAEESDLKPNEEESASFCVDGGYLSETRFLTMLRYHFMTSKDVRNFRITRIHDDMLCNLSTLQLVAFQNDEVFLDFMQTHRSRFEELGLLMPTSLCDVDLVRLVNEKRNAALKEGGKLSQYNSIYTQCKQEHYLARWERSRFQLCEMLRGLRYYFPAFVDFRGRIYRTGLISLHERELIRSITCFSWEYKCSPEEKQQCSEVLQTYVGHHIRKWKSNKEAYNAASAYKSCTNQAFDVQSLLTDSNHKLLAARAALWYNRGKDLHLCPISSDASSSAYQFMSYLTCDVLLAEQTNLIASGTGEFRDLYSEFADWLATKVLNSNSRLPGGLSISDLANRKLMKMALMPKVYGKTVYALGDDLQDFFQHKMLSRQESIELAVLIYSFAEERFKRLHIFMRMCKALASLCCDLDRPVFICNEFLSIVQDYRKHEDCHVYVYDYREKQKKRVSLRRSTEQRDSRQSGQAITANLIHSLDAFVAQNGIGMFARAYPKAPLYSIHDCFITSPLHVECLPRFYNQSMLKLGNPIALLNRFVSSNLFDDKQAAFEDRSEPFEFETLLTQIVIPNALGTVEKNRAQKRKDTFINCYTDFMQGYSQYPVEPGVFAPSPKVQSGVIRLRRNSKLSLDCDVFVQSGQGRFSTA